ncbi:aldehyde dehydrogenase (ALDH) [Monocercomonoides exilis]|uniref:aldehyde dehydrogenase (ALDH) n=1 Tax=Monocercomonoides exilis TaxID=2049356 RepID=UPI00355A17D1|nr:aldehyde dehydrogenase (ALDH) [Monocercomonoides exilis]|eukprot:MONOS_3160.1-p1 / transcript=MONOS_3160.1 / gene=MONOS_3160 / organism=Monocercomonoides_exilis_PA203 / gene_product=aldehyde dehydrogenase (ALDH) / transcript_product=aldehyde dehydrogenase (ALDH) / location=Mono_scaffold00072:46458-47873(-) / protein_length=472 / sequence_SO=supercontig / SO=protein_coding / is_pseudo=false
MELSLIKNELDTALSNLNQWIKQESLETPWHHIKGVTTTALYPQPIGVVLIVSPWNYPLLLSLQPLVGAIAAGCCVCIKPSSVTCNTSHLLATLIPRYLDNRCYRVVEGGHDVSDALLELKWDKIFFTGSASVGRSIYQKAAKFLTPVILELGGKSPAIVDSTADLKITCRRLTYGKFMNLGQTCIAPDYVLVDETVAVPFAEMMMQTIREFYGEDPKKSEDLCRMASKKHYDRLVEILQKDAQNEEATISETATMENKETAQLSSDATAGVVQQPSISASASSSSSDMPSSDTVMSGLSRLFNPSRHQSGHIVIYGGGVDPEDLWIEPTLVTTTMTSTTRLMQEEIFGPVLPIISVKHETFLDDCISFINKRERPLCVYLFTSDSDSKNRILEGTTSGATIVNECLIQLSAESLPFGGVGESGTGCYHGKKTFDAFTHHKAYMDKAKIMDLDVRYPPFTEKKLSSLKKIM